jgi:RND family efflux transporter MFP subunit
LLAIACRRQAPATALPPPLVRVHRIAPRAAASLELRGSIAAAHRVRLGFKQMGVIAALTVDNGARVARGQIVGRLNDVDARSFVRAAQAARDKAERDAQRAERLSTQGALPSSVRDDAKSQLEAAEAQLAQAREALARTQLASPVAGTVLSRLAEPGETVNAAAPVFIIDSADALIARAGATARERERLRVGLAAVLVLDDGPTRPGRVTSLATTPNAEDGLYAVEVTPDSARPALLAGALARMRFEGSRQASVVSIPLDALVHRQDRDYVFALETKNGQTVARLRPIEVDRVEGTALLVRDGLTGGQPIVAEGAYFLQDGQAVRTMD